MNTCPDCGANFRAPSNFLNKPCCGRARDAQADKGSLTLSLVDAPANPTEGLQHMDPATKQLLVYRSGRWTPLTPNQAQAEIQEQLRVATEQLGQVLRDNLMGAMEEIEGRVPTENEILEYSAIRRRKKQGELQEIYYWRKQPICLVRFCVRDGNSITHRIEPANKHPEILPLK